MVGGGCGAKRGKYVGIIASVRRALRNQGLLSENPGLCGYSRTYQAGRVAANVMRKLKEIPLVKPGCTLRCRNQAYKTRVSMLKRSLGFNYIGASIPHNCNQDQHSTVRGVLRRLMLATPQIDGARLRRFRSFVRMWLRSEARRHGLMPLRTVLTFEQWLDSTHYPEWRKQELRVARRRLDEGIPMRRLYEIGCFDKIEGLEGAKENRIINARCDYSKVMFGPMVKSIEHAVYELPEFVKHVPVWQFPDVISERCTPSPGQKVIATDYTSFEGHFDPVLIKSCEGQLYTYMMQFVDPDLASTFVGVLSGTNVAKSPKLHYTVRGCRMSGDMCTSLGNGFTNLMVMKFLCYENRSSCEGFVEGDDGIFKITGPIPTAQDYASLGFSIKIDLCDDPQLASFCGQVYAKNSKDIIVDPVYAALSVGWTAGDQRHGKEAVIRGLSRAKAISLAYQAPGCPIVAALARAMLRLTDGVTPVFSTIHGMRDYWELYLMGDVIKLSPTVLKKLHVGPTLESRSVMERMYGFSVEDQKTLETYFDGWTELKPWSHPLITSHIPEDYRDYDRQHTYVFPQGSRLDAPFSANLDRTYGYDVRGLGFKSPTGEGDSEIARDVFAAIHLVGRSSTVVPSNNH